uniref:Uncharacterized protein n=1 Tax=Anopheles culicifacies TaxID=139723 RepID=A0A182MT45_9DIPT
MRQKEGGGAKLEGKEFIVQIPEIPLRNGFRSISQSTVKQPVGPATRIKQPRVERPQHEFIIARHIKPFVTKTGAASGCQLTGSPRSLGFGDGAGTSQRGTTFLNKSTVTRAFDVRSAMVSAKRIATSRSPIIIIIIIIFIISRAGCMGSRYNLSATQNTVSYVVQAAWALDTICQLRKTLSATCSVRHRHRTIEVLEIWFSLSKGNTFVGGYGEQYEGKCENSCDENHAMHVLKMMFPITPLNVFMAGESGCPCNMLAVNG